MRWRSDVKNQEQIGKLTSQGFGTFRIAVVLFFVLQYVYVEEVKTEKKTNGLHRKVKL